MYLLCCFLYQLGWRHAVSALEPVYNNTLSNSVQASSQPVTEALSHNQHDPTDWFDVQENGTSIHTNTNQNFTLVATEALVPFEFPDPLEFDCDVARVYLVGELRLMALLEQPDGEGKEVEYAHRRTDELLQTWGDICSAEPKPADLSEPSDSVDQERKTETETGVLVQTQAQAQVQAAYVHLDAKGQHPLLSPELVLAVASSDADSDSGKATDDPESEGLQAARVVMFWDWVEYQVKEQDQFAGEAPSIPILP